MILSAARIWKTSALNQCFLSCPRHPGPIHANPQSQSLDSKGNSDHARLLTVDTKTTCHISPISDSHCYQTHQFGVE